MEAYISGSPLDIAVTTCNVSFKHKIDAGTLLALLKGEKPVDGQWQSHLHVFFNEVHPCIIAKIAVDQHLGMESLAKVFFGFEKVFQEPNFLSLYNAAKQHGLESIWQENAGKCSLTMQ